MSYSQAGKDLRKLAQDNVLYLNGDVKVVVGIDINYSVEEVNSIAVASTIDIGRYGWRGDARGGTAPG